MLLCLLITHLSKITMHHINSQCVVKGLKWQIYNILLTWEGRSRIKEDRDPASTKWIVHAAFLLAYFKVIANLKLCVRYWSHFFIFYVEFWSYINKHKRYKTITNIRQQEKKNKGKKIICISSVTKYIENNYWE